MVEVAQVTGDFSGEWLEFVIYVGRYNYEETTTVAKDGTERCRCSTFMNFGHTIKLGCVEFTGTKAIGEVGCLCLREVSCNDVIELGGDGG